MILKTKFICTKYIKEKNVLAQVWKFIIFDFKKFKFEKHIITSDGLGYYEDIIL
jgi:hypothetical protein